MWEERLTGSGSSGADADLACSGAYGLDFPEALDMYRVAQLHGFDDPREAVEWCRAERTREAHLLKTRSDGPSELNSMLSFAGCDGLFSKPPNRLIANS